MYTELLATLNVNKNGNEVEQVLVWLRDTYNSEYVDSSITRQEYDPDMRNYLRTSGKVSRIERPENIYTYFRELAEEWRYRLNQQYGLDAVDRIELCVTLELNGRRVDLNLRTVGNRIRADIWEYKSAAHGYQEMAHKMQLLDRPEDLFRFSAEQAGEYPKKLVSDVKEQLKREIDELLPQMEAAETGTARRELIFKEVDTRVAKLTAIMADEALAAEPVGA